MYLLIMACILGSQRKYEISNDVTISGGVKFLPSFYNRKSKIEIHNNARIGLGVLSVGVGHDT